MSASGTEADAPTKLSATGQDVADRSRRQLRPYRRWQRQQIKLHLAQPYDAEWRELARWLSRLTPDDDDALVEYVCNAR